MSIGEIKNSLENSIEDMMVADVEVGCFLSGGIDSSLVASVMQKKNNKKIKTFLLDLMNMNMMSQSMQKTLQII